MLARIAQFADILADSREQIKQVLSAPLQQHKARMFVLMYQFDYDGIVGKPGWT